MQADRDTRKPLALWAWQHGAIEPVSDITVEDVAFNEIEGWREDAVGEALRANRLFLPDQAGSPGDAHEYLETHYRALRIRHGEPGLLTAYYEPELRGCRIMDGAYTVPIYRRPPELIPLDPLDEQAAELVQSGLTAGIRTNDAFAPFASRAEIEAGALTGRRLELLYVDDPLDAYLMHVQGSGLVHLAEGGSVRLAFDGKNGHPYTSIGKAMIERGLLSPDTATLDDVLGVLKQDAERARALLAENKSYIFFREREDKTDAALGSSGAHLVRGRSLAVDPRYHAFGTLLWVSAPGLSFEGRPFRRLMAAHDTGSAIRGPQRGDLFCGTGAEAGAFAGRVRHSCEFIVLQPKTP